VRDCLFTRVLLGPLVLLPALMGCHLGHTVPTIPIVVLDAETKMPVPGAEVRLWSPSDNRKTTTEPSGTTGPDGIARIQAEYPKEADILVEVVAQGYLQDDIDRILAGKVPGAPTGGGIVEIYKGPRPVLELVIPTDLRGDLKVELRTQDATPDQLGKRTFRYTAPSGRFGSTEMPVAHVVGPPILEGRRGPEFRGIYASTDKPMPLEPKDNEIVLRWVRSEGSDHFFVIGTKIDQESARRASEKNIGPREMNNKSKGDGGGGGRRGGGGGGGGSGGTGAGASARPGFGANGVGGSGGY
jgi:uncharacterized membrane protein YgcG